MYAGDEFYVKYLQILDKGLLISLMWQSSNFIVIVKILETRAKNGDFTCSSNRHIS